MKKNFIPSLKSLLNKLTGVSTDCTYVGKNSSGAVKTWVPADLVQ